MALRDLSDPQAVRRAIREFDEIGRDAFLERYDVGPARFYVISIAGASYDAKAIAAAAHGYQFPDEGPLRAGEFTSGLGTVVPKLRSLGFTVIDIREHDAPQPRPLDRTFDVGRIYSWDELGELLDFDPGYLGSAGGMVSRPDLDILMLITHPGGARSIDYGDYWDGDDLVYTGRGRQGDQQRTGPNRDVGDNARDLHVFEHAGPRQLNYLGQADCTDEWVARQWHRARRSALPPSLPARRAPARPWPGRANPAAVRTHRPRPRIRSGRRADPTPI